MAAGSPLRRMGNKNVALFLLDVLEAVERNGDENDQAGEHKLQVGINTQNRQGVCKGGKDQYTGYYSGDLTDTTCE